MVKAFSFQICEAGGLAIIHKSNEPNFARGQPVKYVFMFLFGGILLGSGDQKEPIV